MCPTWRTLPPDKATARRQIRAERQARLNQQPPAERQSDADRLAAALSEPLSRLDRAARVAAYESLPTEPPTETLIDALRTRGVEVIVPILLPDQDLDWRRADEDTPLGLDAIAACALIVVPALAIDRDGRRLGQGGGSYDRALVRRSRCAMVIGCVYDEELARVVPSDPHDQPVDQTLTPTHGLLG